MFGHFVRRFSHWGQTTILLYNWYDMTSIQNVLNNYKWKDNRRLCTCQSLSQFLTSWPSYLIFDLEKLRPASDYICGPILVTVSQKLWLVSSWTQYIVEYKGLICRHPVTSLATFSLKKTFVLVNSNMILKYFWCKIKAILTITKFSKLRSYRTFLPYISRELCMLTK